MSVKSWIGLVLAPAIALAAQSTLYSMVTPSCSAQVRIDMHLVAAVALVAAAVLAFLAFGESSLRRGEPASPDHDGAHPPVPRRFLADMAAALPGQNSHHIQAKWCALWVHGPCALF